MADTLARLETAHRLGFEPPREISRTWLQNEAAGRDLQTKRRLPHESRLDSPIKCSHFVRMKIERGKMAKSIRSGSWSNCATTCGNAVFSH
jgi:hypothetical protein